MAKLGFELKYWGPRQHDLKPRTNGYLLFYRPCDTYFLFIISIFNDSKRGTIIPTEQEKNVGCKRRINLVKSTVAYSLALSPEPDSKPGS